MRKLLVIFIVTLLLVGCSTGNSGNNGNTAEVKDGTYTSTVQGFKGDIVVETTFADGKITDVTVVSHEDTEDIAGPAFEELSETIVAEQSIGVDTVSGATYSTEALLEAVGDAITEAGGNVDDWK